MEWTQFVSACGEFLALSEKQGDSWSAEGPGKNWEKNPQPQPQPDEFYISLRSLRQLKKSEDSKDQIEVVSCRFDIIFSVSYSVPVMYFRMSRSDGSSLTLEEIWKIVRVSSEDLWSTVTQMDHPVLQVPFYAFHPCQTEKLMETLKNKKCVKPLEYFVSWLSFMAGILQIPCSNQYILECCRDESAE